jgi:hypothetical protein
MIETARLIKPVVNRQTRIRRMTLGFSGVVSWDQLPVLERKEPPEAGPLRKTVFSARRWL